MPRGRTADTAGASLAVPEEGFIVGGRRYVPVEPLTYANYRAVMREADAMGLERLPGLVAATPDDARGAAILRALLQSDRAVDFAAALYTVEGESWTPEAAAVNRARFAGATEPEAFVALDRAVLEGVLRFFGLRRTSSTNTDTVSPAAAVPPDSVGARPSAARRATRSGPGAPSSVSSRDRTPTTSTG